MQLFIHSSCGHAVSRSFVFSLDGILHFLFFSTICPATYFHYRSNPSSHTSSLLRRLGFSTLNDARIRLISCRDYGGPKTSMDPYCPSLLCHSILDCNARLGLQGCFSSPSGADSTYLRTCCLCCASTGRLAVPPTPTSAISFSTSPST